MALKRVLRLTSPMMRGSDVKTAQNRLKKNNFKENYHPGDTDGIWGETCMRATKRAKFWLGYPSKLQNGHYDKELDAYLSGETRLGAKYNDQRKNRKKAATNVPMREKALKLAITQIGVKESPRGSNRCKYTQWYGFSGPWCAMFVSWCYDSSGSKSFEKGTRAAYVPWLVQTARQGAYGFAVVSNPEPGDLVCFDWNHDGVSDHVGLFEKWTNRSAGTFKAIEGNTSVGNDSNGGEVMRRDRSRSLVQCFIRAH